MVNVTQVRHNFERDIKEHNLREERGLNSDSILELSIAEERAQLTSFSYILRIKTRFELYKEYGLLQVWFLFTTDLPKPDEEQAQEEGDALIMIAMREYFEEHGVIDSVGWDLPEVEVVDKIPEEVTDNPIYGRIYWQVSFRGNEHHGDRELE